jgi:hypothetical protein
VFGGMLPQIGLYVISSTGNYPIAVAALTFVVGSLLLRETHHILIWAEVDDRLLPVAATEPEE